MSQLQFGEISISLSNAQRAASLPCVSSGPIELTITIFDSFGRDCQREKFQLKSGTSNLNFRLPALEPGRYTAWIRSNGKDYLRCFELDVSQPVKNSLLSKFRLSLF